MRQKVIIGFLVVALILGFATIPPGHVLASDGKVNVLFVYSSDCNECMNILGIDVPSWINQYGDQVAILSIDISKPGNEQIYNSLKSDYEVQDKPLPIVIIGGSVFAGPDEVRTEVPNAIGQAISNGGTDFPFSTENNQSSNITILLISTCIFLLIIAGLAFGWIKTSSQLQRTAKKKDKVEEENTDLRRKVDDLKRSEEELRKQIGELNRKIASDPVLSALIGLGNSPVDYLSEAMRILYFNDKRSAEATARDVTGYLIGMLKMISGFTEIEAIGYYQQEVEFTSRLHICNKPVPEGESVKIIESGWRRKDIILKKAIVEKSTKGETR